jgi:2,3-bisphosphoglycerate-dependent phosphoglycerate mutase
LKDTVERALPYWHDSIVPAIRSGQKVLIAAHGNSLRALIKYLDKVPDQEIVELNLPTGITKRIFISKIMNSIVAPDDVVQKAIEQVANQGKAKK